MEMISAFRKKVFDFIGYMDTFLNGDGLLENLPSWVFVEWSRANDFVQDVNYPSNMLYAGALETVAKLYGVPALQERAQAMRRTVVQQSFDGKFFRDHAVRQKDGTLLVLPDCTEVCQYYAFFFGAATQKTHGALWKCLVRDFGPRRDVEKKWKKIYPVNAFIGDYLRLELLFNAGHRRAGLTEIKEYFLKMAKLTGTLWEHNTTKASCCHGFASYINCLLLK